MSSTESTTIIRIGSITGFSGAISVSYMPERGWVEIYAHDPDDMRKTGIFLGLTGAGFQDLKALLGQVDDAIEAEVQRRLRSQSAGPERAHGEEGNIVIALSGSNVSLPEDLYKQAAALVAEGKTLLAASLISKSLSWIGLSGAKALALAICEHQRAKGVRK